VNALILRLDESVSVAAQYYIQRRWKLCTDFGGEFYVGKY